LYLCQSGWHAFKKLGANIALRKAMRVKSIFYLLQKFNFFFLVGFCVLIVQMRKQSQQFLQTLDIILPSLLVILSFFSVSVKLTPISGCAGFEVLMLVSLVRSPSVEHWWLPVACSKSKILSYLTDIPVWVGAMTVR
jgi:hypothetical protein